LISLNIADISSKLFEITESSFEYYSPLDNLGRCGSCVASIGQDLMPQKPRESISSVKPTGWQNKQYDHIDGKSLYNRCHLIGFQLTAENANQKNLITGTRYLNTEGMLPFENMVADYIKETGNHVMYRVTPHFVGDNLLASGVYMEGYSVEDEGAGICFFVYCYNVQPGIFLRYEDGANWEIEEGTYAPSEKEGDASYVLNVSSKKFHLPSCNGVRDMNEKNKVLSHESRELLIEEGFVPCGTCKP